MKLVKILARKLKEWPSKAKGYTQDRNGKIYPRTGLNVSFNGNVWTSQGLYMLYGLEFNSNKLATDHATAIVTRADWEAERAKLKAPNANADGWVRNRGRSNKSPVDTGVTCTVKFRDGSEATGKVGNLRWLHDGGSVDVMRYKIHRPSEQPCPVEAKATERLAALDPAKTVSLEEMEQRFAGPLEWRDRIRELDTQRAEVESTYKRQISEITQERESLVQKLAGEGLALVEVAVQPVEDMSDQANWRKGDFVECVKSTDSNGITIGKVYQLTYVTKDCIGFLDDEGDHRDRADVDKFKWHSRPAS